MFCHKCGNEIINEAGFCQKCGARAVTNEAANPTNEATDSVNSGAEGNINKLACPKCGSRNLVSVIKTKVSGGNSASEACCGYALLGPLGLLCGLHKTQIVNQTHWVCQECGEQFRDAKELSQQQLSYGIAFIVVGGFMLWIQIESDFWWPLWIFGIGLVTCGTALIALWSKSRK